MTYSNKQSRTSRPVELLSMADKSSVKGDWPSLTAVDGRLTTPET